MTIKWIRDTYKVPAKIGMVVKFMNSPVLIISTQGPHLRVRYLFEKKTFSIHPTWEVEYPKHEDHE